MLLVKTPSSIVTVMPIATTSGAVQNDAVLECARVHTLVLLMHLQFVVGAICSMLTVIDRVAHWIGVFAGFGSYGD